MHKNKRYESNPNRFSFNVLHLNVLANRCSDQDPQRGFPLVNKKFLPLENRKPGLIGAVMGSDLVCLVEVEPDQWDLENDFSGIFNYELFTGGNSHGVALMWKRSKFTKVGGLVTKLDGRSQVMVAVMLEYVSKDDAGPGLRRKVLLVGTHLKSGEENYKIRTYQAHDIRRHITGFMRDAHHAILCGDLNCEPNAMAHKILQTDFGNDPFNLKNERIEFEKLSLNTPTTLKYRSKTKDSLPEKICKIEDYIMLSQSFNVHVVEANICPNIYAHKEDENSPYKGFPCRTWDSDHCSLALKLEVDSMFDRDCEDYDYFKE